MSIKLTNTQLAILSAAAQREDRCLTLPKTLKGSSAQKVSSKLLADGLVREILAKSEVPIWRRDEEAEKSYSLKLTVAGMKAIAVQTGGVDEIADHATPSGTAASSRASAKPNPAAETRVTLATPTDPTSTAIEVAGPTARDPSIASTTAPREGTKMAGVVGLLERDKGATLAELMAATAWLPHTVRAALTGLRKRGFIVTLDRSSKERGSSYVISRDQSAAGEAAVVEPSEPTPAPATGAKTSNRRAKSERAAATIGSAA